jgi:hypothetical protein
LSKLVREICLASASYGVCVGSVHSLTFALRNLVKLPLLLLTTCTICALAYYVSGQFISRQLRLADVVHLALQTFRELSLLLASLCPACLFLALTIHQPDGQGLNEYPLFLGLNVLFIALAGAIALVRQAWSLLHGYRLGLSRSLAAVAAWLALSLLVGGQCAWYLRPFYGISTISAPFFEGTLPDHRGDTNFYESVWHIVDPPER